MTPKEFQQLHGFTDDELEILRLICKVFKGRIEKIDKSKSGAKNGK